MAKKFHAALAACSGAFMLSAAGVAPPASDEAVTAVVAAPETPVTQADLPVPTIDPTEDLVQPARDLAAVPTVATSPSISDEERRCLAIAVYHESRGEPRAGQLAVAQVILNRAKSGRFPRSLCGVIRQPSQFPGLRDAGYAPRPGRDWAVAQDVADDVLAGERAAIAHGAMYFHATRVSPEWRGRTRLATIGNHVFYR